MLDREDTEKLLKKVIRHSKADEVEAHIGGGSSALTRFADNRIHQNVAEQGYYIFINSIFGKKIGRAGTNLLNDEALKQVVAASENIAKLMPDDPGLLPLLEPQEYRQTNGYYESTSKFGPQKRAEAVKGAVEICRANGCVAAGAFDASDGITAMMNSKGLFAYHNGTSANFSITVNKDQQGKVGKGWAGFGSRAVEDVDVRKLTQIAVEKAALSCQTKELKPGRYDVLLEPAAIAELMGYVVGAFTSQSVDEERSFITDKLGKKIAIDALNITDNTYHPLHQDAPFDGEGVPKQVVKLIENGVASQLLYTRKNAKKHNTKPTGSGGAIPNPWGESPSSIVIGGGAKDLPALLKSFKKGILITHFWYSNTVDERKCLVTGLTRDGTFWVEDGKIQYAINNFRINQSMPELLNNIVEMGAPVRSGGMVVPPMIVRDFNFSSSTEGR